MAVAARFIEQSSSGLQSSDVKSRTEALGNLNSRLRERGRLQGIKKDVLVRLMSDAISCMKDANPKCSTLAIECAQLLMEHHPSEFTPVEAMTFDLFLSKYGDGKVSIRSAAMSALVRLLYRLSGGIGFGQFMDKLLGFLNSKSAKVKEHVLMTLAILYHYKKEELMRIPRLVHRISELLSDSTISVRSLAIDSLALLHDSLGDGLLEQLENFGVKIAILERIQEAVTSASYKSILESSGVNLAELAPEKIAPVAAGAGSPILGRTTGNVCSGSSINATSRPTSSSNKASSDSSKFSHSGGAGRSSPLNTMKTFSSSLQQQECLYELGHYLNLVQEGPQATPARIYSERDLASTFEQANAELADTEDWQARMRGLASIQSLVLGDAVEFERELVQQLRTSMTYILAQVADLRSVLSKEGSRTLAIMALRLGSACAPLVDQAFAALLKLVSIKTKTISNAADRAIRVIIASAGSGNPRLLGNIADSCASKNSLSRRVSFEYLNLACVLWRSDVVGKSMSLLKRVITSGVSDADGAVRRSARHLFWVSFHMPGFNREMEKHLDSLDNTVQKHIHLEFQTSIEENDGGDLNVLLELLEQDFSPLPTDLSKALLLLTFDPEPDVEAVPATEVCTEGEGSGDKATTEKRHAPKPIGDGGSFPREAPIESETHPKLPPQVNVLSTFREESSASDAAFPHVSSNSTVYTSASAPANLSGPSQHTSTPKGNTTGKKAVGHDSSSEKSPRAASGSSPDYTAEFTHVTLDLLQEMVADKDWVSRGRALKIMRLRLEAESRAVTPETTEVYLGMAIICAGDMHQKVAAEALQVVATVVEKYSSHAQPRLGQMLVTLFQRLSDRRQIVRTSANSLLNSVRIAFEPVVIVAALSPKILDLPERVKAAVVQYLSITVPHCGAYFIVPQNTLAFLGRIACVLGAMGSSTPSAALLSSGRRLVEMLYNTAPMVVLSQLPVLPIEQQTCLKRLLGHTVTNIDTLIVAAVKQARLEAIKPISPQMQAGKSIKMSTTPQRCNEASSDESVPATCASVVVEAERDVLWLLESLSLESPHTKKMEALKELKSLAKTAPAGYWQENCAQIITVLLEVFTANTAENASTAPTKMGAYSVKVNENSPPGQAEYLRNKAALQSAVVKESQSSSEPLAAAKDVAHGADSMHLACKGLLLLVRHQPDHVANFIDLLVSKLCQAAATAPVAVSLHCEQILIDLAQKNALRMLRGLVPYTMDPEFVPAAPSPLELPVHQSDIRRKGTTPNTRLLALHVLAEIMKYLPSPHLLPEVPSLVRAVLPSLLCPIVDLRKAVVFVLVEAYMVIGDALYPYVKDLPPPQRKLLTIYIERQLKSQANK